MLLPQIDLGRDGTAWTQVIPNKHNLNQRFSTFLVLRFPVPSQNFSRLSLSPHPLSLSGKFEGVDPHGSTASLYREQ